MILRQFLHRDPAIAVSYLIACGGKGVAAVIDPVYPPERYLSVAADHGVTIKAVIDTHLHADHISSGRALAAAANAPYLLHARAEALYEFAGVRAADRLELGNVVAEIRELPGHTPEHIGLVVTDRTRASEPWLVFTGHTLMVGDMGRTELASSAEDGASALFESARWLAALPDYVQVMPGAFSGSVCGRSLSGVPVTTIGFERRFNRAFAITDRTAFIEHMLRDVPTPPPQAQQIRLINSGITKQPS